MLMRNALTIAALLTIITNISMGQSYNTIEKFKVKAICSERGIKEFSSNKINHSLIYKLNTGEVIVWPASGNLALQFENEQKFDSAIVDNHIPLKSTDPIEREEDQAIVKGLPDNAQFVIDGLSNKLGMTLKLEGLDDEYISSFVDKIAKYGNDKAYDDLFLALTIYFGEISRRLRHSQWKLVLKYGINPYYDLELFNEQRTFFITREVVRFLEAKSKKEKLAMLAPFRSR
jgi:hypothetical protein